MKSNHDSEPKKTVQSVQRSVPAQEQLIPNRTILIHLSTELVFWLQSYSLNAHGSH